VRSVLTFVTLRLGLRNKGARNSGGVWRCSFFFLFFWLCIGKVWESFGPFLLNLNSLGSIYRRTGLIHQNIESVVHDRG
jgi:hypothetical protein